MSIVLFSPKVPSFISGGYGKNWGTQEAASGQPPEVFSEARINKSSYSTALLQVNDQIDEAAFSQVVTMSTKRPMSEEGRGKGVIII